MNFTLQRQLRPRYASTRGEGGREGGREEGGRRCCVVGWDQVTLFLSAKEQLMRASLMKIIKDKFNWLKWPPTFKLIELSMVLRNGIMGTRYTSN